MYFPVFARVRIQAPHVFAQILIPKNVFLHVAVLCRGVPANKTRGFAETYLWEIQRDFVTSRSLKKMDFSGNFASRMSTTKDYRGRYDYRIRSQIFNVSISRDMISCY